MRSPIVMLSKVICILIYKLMKDPKVWNHAYRQAWRNYASVLVCHNIDVWRILQSYSKGKVHVLRFVLKRV